MEHCYAILCEAEKWKTRFEVSRTNGEEGSTSSGAIDGTDDEERPMGRKRAKKTITESSEKSEMWGEHRIDQEIARKQNDEKNQALQGEPGSKDYAG